jgi:hypothetical protein
VDQFRVFRAMGLAFKAWFANFIPFTLVLAVLYAPLIYWTLLLPTTDAESQATQDAYLTFFSRAPYLLVGMTMFISPLITYRVIQYLNGAKSSMGTSLRFGIRGILPAIIMAVATTLVQMLPAGFILGMILTCWWFVAGPAAVVERLNPIEALSRSAVLTNGRRWGIFGIYLTIIIVVVVVVLAWFVPMFANLKNSDSDLSTARNAVLAFIVMYGIFQLYTGIVQAVSYSLLRGDKDGVSNDELAKVFE